MKLKLVRHLWGVNLQHGLETFLPRWRDVGYEALEVSWRFVPDQPAFIRFLKQNRFGWIPQVYTNDFTPGGSIHLHLDSLKQQVEECLKHQPLFFNAHSGSDAWSGAEAEDFYGAAIEFERQIGVTIAHETHRRRYFSNPWMTRAILQRFPDLKLTCDFSHWVCVAERLLEDCGPLLQLAAQRCHHLHARVGYEHGPQVSDPRAPEWSRHLAAHQNWWDQIWTAQKKRGMKISTLTPEFGPPPYLHTLPYTQTPIADLSDVCDWMATRQAAHFRELTMPSKRASKQK